MLGDKIDNTKTNVYPKDFSFIPGEERNWTKQVIYSFKHAFNTSNK